MSLQTWVEGLVKTAVDEAIQDLHDDIQADLTGMETRILGQLNTLPGLVGSQVETVVAGVVQDVAALPQQIIDGIVSRILGGSK